MLAGGQVAELKHLLVDEPLADLEPLLALGSCFLTELDLMAFLLQAEIRRVDRRDVERPGDHFLRPEVDSVAETLRVEHRSTHEAALNPAF